MRSSTQTRSVDFEVATGSRGARVPALLAPYRFRRGFRCSPAELSPAIPPEARRQLSGWLEALPPELTARLPTIKISVVDWSQTPAGHMAHGVSFIPQGYLLLSGSLLKRPGELGRILYHEICHFLWPRLGSRRRVFEAAIAGELKAGVAGELGASAESAKQALYNGDGHRSSTARQAVRYRLKAGAISGTDKNARPHWRRWRYYLCESFCDTGAWLLLERAGRRRRRHSEWTLPDRARSLRLRAWSDTVGIESEK